MSIEKLESVEEGQEIVLTGHLAARRNLGQLTFLTLRDRTGQIQLVIESGQEFESLREQARQINLETALRVRGTLKRQVQENKAPQTELQLLQLEALCQSNHAHTLPVEINKNKKIDGLSPSSLFDYRPLTLRNEKVRAIFKLEAEILKAFRNYLNGEGFTEIHSPKIVATGTEGGANLFRLDYFGRPAFLAQSPQFYKQIMVGALERVFEVGPVYRAEEHDTTRHLNEYISLDFEMGFIENMQDLIAMQEGLINHILNHLNTNCQQELAIYGATLPTAPAFLKSGKIPQIELAQAQSLLQEKYKWQSQSKDLDAEGERLICQHVFEETGSEFVYITNYPHHIRPFYAMKTASGGSQSFDLLFRGLEVTTGGQRIHEYNELVSSIEERGMKAEEFADYLLCFKHGMPPHGGLAFGLERLAKQLLGLASVKQAALFPRDRTRLTP